MTTAIVLGATAISTARIVARLAGFLGGKGIITTAEIEVMRHHALHDFDAVFETMGGAPPALRAELDNVRSILEARWDDAVKRASAATS